MPTGTTKVRWKRQRINDSRLLNHESILDWILDEASECCCVLYRHAEVRKKTVVVVHLFDYSVAWLLTRGNPFFQRVAWNAKVDDPLTMIVHSRCWTGTFYIFCDDHNNHKVHLCTSHYFNLMAQCITKLEMWANAQRDGRHAEYRWRPLFNAAKFGWRPLPECRAVTLPRRETLWNLQGYLKLANRSQPLVGRSSLHHIVRTWGGIAD